MKAFLLYLLASLITYTTVAQTNNKEKAQLLAENEFSKTKSVKKEKYGITKEKTSVIRSTIVPSDDLSFYAGNYVYDDLDYKLEIRLDPQNKLMATLSRPSIPDLLLQDVLVDGAFFQAVKQNPDGTKETWEGAFINKNDNGTTEFGLGIKLGNAIQLTPGLKLTRIFFKKVSP